MTEGISALGGMSSLSLVDAISNKTSSKKEDEQSSDIFDLMFQTIDESLNKVQDSLGQTSSTSASASSDLNFGPPSNITIENFDYSAEDTTSESASLTELAGQPTGGAGGTSGSGGESSDEDDEDESNNPMDLNQDGTVTIDEMLSYFEAQESYGSSGNGGNSNSQNANQFEQIFDMLV